MNHVRSMEQVEVCSLDTGNHMLCGGCGPDRQRKSNRLCHGMERTGGTAGYRHGTAPFWPPFIATATSHNSSSHAQRAATFSAVSV